MKTTRQKIKESNDTRIVEMGSELDNFIGLDALSISDGGKLLIGSLKKDIITTIETLASGYKELTQTQFIGHCAGLKERLDILRALTRARKNKEFITEEINKLLDEALD